MEGLPFEGKSGERLRGAVFVAVVILGLFLLVQAFAGIMNLRYIGAGLQATNTINVSGYGESFGVPDIATFTFSVSSEKATVALAQAEATAKINAIAAYLKGAGVDEKDIKTTDYSVYPQYDYKTEVCAAGYPCGGKQTLRGYEVRQTTTVKVRSTDKAGDLLTGVGEKGATEVSGLNFTFDKPDQVQTQARDKAIADAKEKADMLAKQLGVRIVRVVSYSDSGSYPQPMMYARDMAYGSAGVANEKAVAPTLSVGENKVTSNVTITYEIR